MPALLRVRYYKPDTGRLLSRDSYEGEMENPLSKHLYAYVHNNPTRYIDPSGYRLQKEEEEMKAVGLSLYRVKLLTAVDHYMMSNLRRVT